MISDAKTSSIQEKENPREFQLPHGKFLWFAVAFPILVMAALMLQKQNVVSQGQRITLQISGYDPRDLLSGHYLIYQVEYGVVPNCTAGNGTFEAHVCLNDRTFRFGPVLNCQLPIAGTCENGRFVAGIERFYVPQEQAGELEKHVMGKNAAIEVSIKNGRAQVIDLLINGRTWREQLKTKDGNKSNSSQ